MAIQSGAKAVSSFDLNLRVLGKNVPRLVVPAGSVSGTKELVWVGQFPQVQHIERIVDATAVIQHEVPTIQSVQKMRVSVSIEW